MMRLATFPALTFAVGLAGSAHAQEASAVPSGALKAYCAAAGDTSPATFGDGRNGPAIEWRCVHGSVFVCETGADGVACSARSRSRVPLPSMAEACREDGQLS